MIVCAAVVAVYLFAFGACAAGPKVIFDTDMYMDYDDVGALALLHTLADAGECEILGTISCTRDSMSVAAIEIINAYYGRTDLPVACTARSGGVAGMNDLHKHFYARLVKDYKDWVRHANSSDAPDAVRVYRRLLAGQEDGSVVICSVGFLTNIADLLMSKGDDISPLTGVELVAKKVKLWVAMACKYPRGKECNSKMDAASSRTAIEKCPVPILFSDFDYGIKVLSGRKVAETSYPTRNPVHDIFKRHLPSRESVKSGKSGYPADQPLGHFSWDQTAVLAAVRGTGTYFDTQRGTYKIVDDKGSNEWTPAANGPHARLVEKMPYGEVSRVIDDLIAVGQKDFTVERIFREPRYTRGNTNIIRVQPIDYASWIWLPNDNSKRKVVKFKKTFAVTNAAPLTIDVSADERFYLTLDGKFIARGPNRGTVENWQYQTYTINNLKPGEHVLEAVVWRFGDASPVAQITWRGGFVLKADGVYDAALTTGKTDWQVGEIAGVVHTIGWGNGAWGGGEQFEIRGRGLYAVEPKSSVKAEVVRHPAGANYTGCGYYSGRTGGWMLFPSQIPDQTETVVMPGKFRAATTNAPWRGTHTYTEAETKSPWIEKFNELLKNGKAVTIPPKTRLQLAWNLERYICAYPELVTMGGKGARVSWTWTESARDEKTKRKNERGAIVGKYLEGFGDVFMTDGEKGVFSAPWWRCGLWCRLDIETKDEPLTLTSLKMIESRYPLELESVFTSPQDASLQDIRRICARAMQMCSHEMFFDCPYYEQQMYTGDTRVELLVLAAMARDDRLIRRAIEIFDLATRDNGMCPMNWPSRLLQEGSSYTLCYLLMYGDYVMNHTNRDWLKARLPGMRKSMAAFECYEREDGLVANLPGWHFMDWSPSWHFGIPPGGMDRDGLICQMNLFWLLAMQSAEKVERAFGNEHLAAHWRTRAEKLKGAIVKTFWHEKRGMLADNPEKTSFSEHSQSLAILADALPKDKAELAFKNLVEDKNLARCTVYFSYYLFEAYFKMGRADLFLKRLDLWRDYVKKGVTTLLECPENVNGDAEARSDCHAWGAHPIWFMQTGLAGIKSDAPFFAKVRVAPQPGSLKEIHATHPHPQGWIKVDLTFDGDKASGSVETPVEGVFIYGGKTIPLAVGINRVK